MPGKELVIENIHADTTQNFVKRLCPSYENVFVLCLAVRLSDESCPLDTDMGNDGYYASSQSLPALILLHTRLNNMFWFDGHSVERLKASFFIY